MQVLCLEFSVRDFSKGIFSDFRGNSLSSFAELLNLTATSVMYWAWLKFSTTSCCFRDNIFLFFDWAWARIDQDKCDLIRSLMGVKTMLTCFLTTICLKVSSLWSGYGLQWCMDTPQSPEPGARFTTLSCSYKLGTSTQSIGQNNCENHNVVLIVFLWSHNYLLQVHQ